MAFHFPIHIESYTKPNGRDDMKGTWRRIFSFNTKKRFRFSFLLLIFNPFSFSNSLANSQRQAGETNTLATPGARILARKFICTRCERKASEGKKLSSENKNRAEKQQNINNGYIMSGMGAHAKTKRRRKKKRNFNVFCFRIWGLIIINETVLCMALESTHFILFGCLFTLVASKIFPASSSSIWFSLAKDFDFLDSKVEGEGKFCFIENVWNVYAT